MSENTKTALKALLAFILRDISEAILNRLPGPEDDEEDYDDDPIEF